MYQPSLSCDSTPLEVSLVEVIRLKWPPVLCFTRHSERQRTQVPIYQRPRCYCVVSTLQTGLHVLPENKQLGTVLQIRSAILSLHSWRQYGQQLQIGTDIANGSGCAGLYQNIQLQWVTPLACLLVSTSHSPMDLHSTRNIQCRPST